MGPPKNTRFVFFTNNREEPKGNTLDCNVYFSLSEKMKPKPLQNHILTLMQICLIVPICYFIFKKNFRFVHSSIKKKVKNIF